MQTGYNTKQKQHGAALLTQDGPAQKTNNGTLNNASLYSTSAYPPDTTTWFTNLLQSPTESSDTTWFTNLLQSPTEPSDTTWFTSLLQNPTDRCLIGERVENVPLKHYHRLICKKSFQDQLHLGRKLCL